MTTSSTRVARSAARTAGRKSRCLTPRYRVEAPAARTTAATCLVDVDRRLLNHDEPRRLLRRRVAELPDPFRDVEPLRHMAEHGVVRRQRCRVGPDDDEELAAGCARR